jgi:hypothetical protein
MKPTHPISEREDGYKEYDEVNYYLGIFLIFLVFVF